MNQFLTEILTFDFVESGNLSMVCEVRRFFAEDIPEFSSRPKIEIRRPTRGGVRKFVSLEKKKRPVNQIAKI